MVTQDDDCVSGLTVPSFPTRIPTLPYPTLRTLLHGRSTFLQPLHVGHGFAQWNVMGDMQASLQRLEMSSHGLAWSLALQPSAVRSTPQERLPLEPGSLNKTCNTDPQPPA